ncbi:thiamine-phosphate kinase [Singulisphaera sp. Ch08]|uniref:Thiamine-monophosphate kinase n=1 Tax=Singulisphaera sp. Ch08 TaxID=3120278 RepID=A0AAU7CPJ8_9BACT
MTGPLNPDRPTGEFSLIDWIRRKTGVGRSTVLGIGDDCAILRPTRDSDWLVTTDMLMDGRHFRLDHDGPEAVGFKALGVNLSDIAAMAGVPVAAVVAVALPKAHAVELAQGIHAGMAPLAAQYGVDLVGGDTNAWDGPLVISITVLGETTARGAVRRSGAMPGDAIVVTGPLGGSLQGRHLRPQPRLLEALALHQAAPLHAMIDISDGLASDLGHILEESGGLGAILDADAIPIHPDARILSAVDSRSTLDHALNDGEDFELCVVVAPDDASRLIKAPPSPALVHRIGEIRAEPGLWLRTRDGQLIAINARGFDHLHE